MVFYVVMGYWEGKSVWNGFIRKMTGTAARRFSLKDLLSYFIKLWNMTIFHKMHSEIPAMELFSRTTFFLGIAKSSEVEVTNSLLNESLIFFIFCLFIYFFILLFQEKKELLWILFNFNDKSSDQQKLQN